MDILWYGSTCFRFAKRGLATVVTDPHLAGGSLDPSVKIVTYHSDPAEIPADASETQGAYVIHGPGEYEVGGVFITGIPSGSGAARNTLYVYHFDPLVIADLGTIDRIPTQSEVEIIGTVNVAIVSAGGTGAWTAAQAAEMISRLEPNIVIPIYPSEDALHKFLKEMGVTELPYQPMLRVIETSLPENTQVMLLEKTAVGRSAP